MSTIPCKVYMNEETHPYLNCWVSSNLPLVDLRRIVERATPKFRLGSIRYLDDEGDKITIETDIELAEALKLGHKLGSLQLFVEPNLAYVPPVEEPAPVATPVAAPEIKVPEKVEAPEETQASPPTHRAICDACNKHIVGIRYKCVNCPDYDLCETCEDVNGSAGSIHQADHIFLKIRRPICPYQRINLPNLYEGAQRRHGHCPVMFRGHGAFNRPRPAYPVPAAQPQANLSEDRFTALEARVAQLAQEVQFVTAKAQKEAAEEKQREEKKQAQEQKRKEVRAILLKAGEERKAIKKEQKLKKDQQRDAARQAAVAKKEIQAARKAAAVAAATAILVPTPAPVIVKIEEEKKEVAVPEVIVQVEEAAEPVEEIKEEEVKEEVVVKIEEVSEEEEKKEDDFVVINDEAPATHSERASYFKESLEILGSMGFTNVERNLELLARHSGDIQAVITVLLDIVEII